jgi:hypothetical protein
MREPYPPQRELKDFLEPLGWGDKTPSDLSDDELLKLIESSTTELLWGTEIGVFGGLVMYWEHRTGREWFPAGHRRRGETVPGGGEE